MNGRATSGRPAGTVAENLFLENYKFVLLCDGFSRYFNLRRGYAITLVTQIKNHSRLRENERCFLWCERYPAKSVASVTENQHWF
jgi:hypothetical protein